ncbi:MAG: hypothetical protein JWO22_2899 [Frankiales bacterium]|nr:hypothetical protein [Frankiales bacterium]
MTERSGEHRLAVCAVAAVGSDWVVVHASRAYRAAMGHEHGTLAGRSLLELVPPAARLRLRVALDTVAASRRAELVRVELLDPAGEPHWFELEVTTRSGDPGELTVHLRDVTDRGATPVSVVTAAHTDQLTGAAIRPVLVDHARHALRRLGRERLWVALLFLDLDRLKPVNDRLGHQAGDAVLRELGRRVQSLLRPGDTFARMGGDEFAVLIGDLHDPADAELLARRIVSVGLIAVDVEGHELDCSVSVGLAITSDATQTTETLLRRADVAMYQAKAAGGGRWSAWGAGDEARLSTRKRVTAVIHEALRTHTVALDYRPVVHLASGQRIGTEALLRVPGPAGEFLRPPDFLEIATSERLIGALDLEVLAQAMSHQDGSSTPLPVDLNLAGIDLENDAWRDRAMETLSDQHAGSGALRVELREEVLRRTSSAALQRLEDLRRGGVQVGLDGFGSDLSALTTLWSYPLDYLKLHPAITWQLPTVRSARALVRALCELAHSLDLLVVANGIESAEQLRLARECGCDQGQGFYWPAPSSAAWLPSAQQRAVPNGHQAVPRPPVSTPGSN